MAPDPARRSGVRLATALKTPRVLIGLGLGLVFLVWIGVSTLPPLVRNAVAPPPAGAGLQVVTGLASDLQLDPNHPLKCFVDGQPVGDMPLSACARRNRVPDGALNVGLDAQGRLGASSGLTSALTPLPPGGDPAGPGAPENPGGGGQAAAPPPAAATPPSDTAGACWRYGDEGWSRNATDLNLSACVQAVFGGRCLAPGVVAYGRWRGRTLRLVNGEVAIMGDDHAFRPLATQTPDCAVGASR